MREPPVAVAFRKATPQSLHPPAEGHVLRPPAAACHGGQRAVVRRRGGQETRVTVFVFVPASLHCFVGVNPEEICDYVMLLFLFRPRAVSEAASLSGETVAVGVVTCLVVYPLYLLVFTLFRMSRSKVARNPPLVLLIYREPSFTLNGLRVFLQQCVSVEQVPAQVDQESVEIDDFLDNSMAGSSFLFFNGEVQGAVQYSEQSDQRGEMKMCRARLECLTLDFFSLSCLSASQTNSEDTNVDLPTPSTKR